MIGTVLSYALTGLLCEYGFDGGWPSPFYIFGGLGIIWSLGWLWSIRDTPAQHPTISKEEKIYIEAYCSHLGEESSTTLKDVPWKSFATSLPVWAIVVGHTCSNWVFYTLVTEIPTYLKDVLHLPASLNGLVTSLPYVCIFLTCFFSAFLADYLRTNWLSTKVVRKLYYGGGFVTSVACLATISFVGCDTTLVVMLLCLAVGLSGFAQNGYIVNHVDIAPPFAGILMGITNTVATLPGIISPVITGFIIIEESSIATWQIVFLISCGVAIFGLLFFCLFADGEVQSWAIVRKNSISDQEKQQLSNGQEIELSVPL